MISLLNGLTQRNRTEACAIDVSSLFIICVWTLSRRLGRVTFEMVRLLR